MISTRSGASVVDTIVYLALGDWVRSVRGGDPRGPSRTGIIVINTLMSQDASHHASQERSFRVALELVGGGHRIGEEIGPSRAPLRLRVDAAHIAAARCGA